MTLGVASRKRGGAEIGLVTEFFFLLSSARDDQSVDPSDLLIQWILQDHLHVDARGPGILTGVDPLGYLG